MMAAIAGAPIIPRARPSVPREANYRIRGDSEKTDKLTLPLSFTGRRTAGILRIEQGERRCGR